MTETAISTPAICEERASVRLVAAGARSAAGPRSRVRPAAATVICTLTLIALIGLFALLGRTLAGPWGPAVDPFDRAAAVWVQSLRSTAADCVFWTLTWIDEDLPMALASGTLFAWMLLSRRRRKAMLMAIAMSGTALMCLATRRIACRQRPAYFGVRQDLADFGYPSGHVMNSVVIATLAVSFIFPRLRTRWQKALLVGACAAYVLGTALSRVYVHAHYATDDIAGFLMGAAWIAVLLPVLGGALPDRTAK